MGMTSRAGKSVTPRYIQLADQLARDIGGGLYPVGTCLPTEHRLCELFDVSRFTVRQALSRLRDSGLVSSEHGVGTRVEAAVRPERFTLSLGSIHEISDFARETGIEILRKAFISPDEADIDLPKVDAQGPWLLVAGLRFAPGRDLPIAMTQIHVSPRFADIHDRIGPTTWPIFALIEERHHEKVTVIRQQISAVTVPDAMVEPLRVAPGTPVLRILRHYLNAAGETLQFSGSIAVSDRFVYSADIITR